tara:strand:+ start:267 stop:389 length:123 start_codon:yes stop_codon:yes gene_type:complete
MAKIDIRRLDKYMDEYPKRKKMVRKKKDENVQPKDRSKRK